MPSETRSPRLAVLIDADNASAKIADGLFEEIAKIGEASVRRIYGDFSNARSRGWADILSKHAIIPQQQFAYTTGKNASDITLVIDAMDLLYRGHVDGFGIMSSDSDFLPLVQRIREEGLPVYGFGTQKTPGPFQEACTRFFDVGALALSDEERLEQPVTAKGQRPVDPELLQVLGSAYKASKRDEEGYTPLSELGQRAKAVSSFAARNYGFGRLSELIKAVPNFEVKAGGDGRLLVKRLR